MRARSSLLALMLAVCSLPLLAPPAAADRSRLVIAQQDEGEPEGGTEGTEEQGNPDVEGETSETEGQTEGGTTETEAGPPWTYQMARISLLLLVFLVLGIIGWYYRFVVSRQKRVA